MNKNNFYTIIKNITPPVIFNMFVSCRIYPTIKNIFSRILPSEYQLEWKKINSGILKDREIYVAGGGVIELMFEENHDDFMFNYISQGDIVFDVGAHVGYDSMCYSEIVGDEGRVFSFEPNPSNINSFKKNLERSKDLAKRINIVNLAISNSKGEQDFLFTDNVEGGTSSGSFIESSDTFFKKSDYEEKTGFKRMKVKTDTLDNFIKHENLNPDVIKIDVEGAEYLVLEGLLDSLDKFKPLLLIEIHSIFNMFKVLEILNLKNFSTQLIKKEDDGRCFLVSKFGKL